MLAYRVRMTLRLDRKMKDAMTNCLKFWKQDASNTDP